MNTLKHRAIKPISITLICITVIVFLSACAGFQSIAQQTLGRVIENTPPPPELAEVAETTAENDATEAEVQFDDELMDEGEERPEIDIQNVADLKVAAEASQNVPHRVIWAVDGQSFGVVNYFQVVRYSAHDLSIEAVFAAQEPAIILGFSPDGQTIATTEDQNSIQLWNIETSRITLEVTPGPFSEAVFLPDGKSLAVSLLDEIAVDIIEVETGHSTGTMAGFETAAPVFRVGFGPSGDTMIWIARAGAQLMAYPSMEMGPEFYHEEFISSLALHPDGSLLAVATAGTVSGEFTPMIQFWNVEDGSNGGEVIAHSIPTSIDFSKNGELILATIGAQIRVWQTSDLADITIFDEHNGAINWMAVSPDGSQLVTTSEDNQIFLWQVNKQ